METLLQFSGLLNIKTMCFVVCMKQSMNTFLLICHCALYKSPGYILECIYFRVYLFDSLLWPMRHEAKEMLLWMHKEAIWTDNDAEAHTVYKSSIRWRFQPLSLRTYKKLYRLRDLVTFTRITYVCPLNIYAMSSASQLLISLIIYRSVTSEIDFREEIPIC